MIPFTKTYVMNQKLSLLVVVNLLVCKLSLFSQCMIYPVSFEQRVNASQIIVLGKVTAQQCFTQKETGLIFTRNTITVNAWLKGTSRLTELSVLTLGGTVGNKSMIAEPSLQLHPEHEYVLMLTETNENTSTVRDPSAPGLVHFIPYADAQGALEAQNLMYSDLLGEKNMTEGELFQKIEQFTHMKALQINGKPYTPRMPVQIQRTGGITSVSGFSPTTTNSGTIVGGDFLTINGINFESARGAGLVAFRNADDGGGSYIAPPVASDYVSWSATSITVKVPRNAGTGDFFVRTNSGVDFLSPSNLTVNYAHLSINNTFLNFSQSTRQRYYLRNLNSQGGYTFTYNNTFFSNPQAIAAFQRAVVSWRCGTGFNIRTSSTTSAIAVAADDNVNIVSFDASLPVGVLARATSYFSGSGINGVCDLTNTVWWLEELDIVFNNPPAAGFTWEFGPAAPSSSEFDFESVAVHEIGHLHGLGHIIAPGQIMHFALANGASSRTLAARDLAAGNAKMSYSTTATCFNPAGSGTPMVAITTGTCVTLPVTLNLFEGKRVNSSANSLTWVTEQELNNDGFILQRSDDGRIFSTLNFIKGKGQSFDKSHYSYTDEKAGPFKRYYRLVQKDFDGRLNYSSIVAINGDNSTKWKIWFSGATLFLYNSVPLQRPATLQLYNSNGQLVFSKPVNSNSVSIPVTLSSKSAYTYRLVTDIEIITGKLSNVF